MNLQPQFPSFYGQPQGPDYAYASAPYGQVATPGIGSLGGVGVRAPFEYGGGQKLTSLMDGMAPTAGYHAGGGMPAPYVGDDVGKSIISSNTSSKDPRALRARVFVGNLNTAMVSREQVYQLYAQFGDMLAISMHKGYAFVQYANENEARNAVSFTDGILLGGKQIDVTISSEPKTSSSEDKFGTKRSVNVTITPSGGADVKKPRLAAPLAAFKKSTTFSGSATTFAPKAAAGTAVKNAKANDDDIGIGDALKQEILARGDDILICGTCRQLCSTLTQFCEHKNAHRPGSGTLPNSDKGDNKAGTKEQASHKPEGEPKQVQCFICHTPFDFSWNLLTHMSKTHNMTVYEIVNDGQDPKTAKKDEK